MDLDSVEIIMDIENHFGIEITDAEVARCDRVGDLLDCRRVKGRERCLRSMRHCEEGLADPTKQSGS